MDFEVTYTEEQQRFRREVRAWLEANVPASVARTPTSAEDNYRRYLELRDLGRKLGAKGWLYPTAPAKYAAAGSTSTTRSSSRKRSIASISRCRPTTTAAVVWLGVDPRVGHGRAASGVLTTDLSGRGPHLAAPDRARRRLGPGRRAHDDGGARRDEYVIKGQKIFVGSDNGTDRIWMIVCTDPKGSATRTSRGS